MRNQSPLKRLIEPQRKLTKQERKRSLQRSVRRRLFALREQLIEIDQLLSDLLKNHRSSLNKIDWYENLRSKLISLVNSGILPVRPASNRVQRSVNLGISRTMGLKPLDSRVLRALIRQKK